jgi:hypothetical protein
MSRVRWHAGAGLLTFGALGCFACSAPVICRSDSELQHGASVSSAQLSGSMLLSAAGDTESFYLDVALAGLPKLWPSSSAIKNADLGLSVALAYTKPPVGGDGLTEMPRVQMGFDRQPGTTTSSFPSIAKGTEQQLFGDCALGGEYCCAFGSEQCHGRLQVTLQRLDGAPFPPVQVAWTVGASATTDSCPQDLGSPTLTLTSEAP